MKQIYAGSDARLSGVTRPPRSSSRSAGLWGTGLAVGLLATLGLACGSSSSGGSGSGSGCSGLATCCGSLPSAEQSNCKTIASSGQESECDTTIQGLHEDHVCSGVSPGAGGSTDGGASGGGATCAQLMTCCSTATFPVMALKSACMTVATGNDPGACAAEYSADVTAGACQALTADGGMSSCAELAACCASLTGGLKAGCQGEAQSAGTNQAACANTLRDYATSGGTCGAM